MAVEEEQIRTETGGGGGWGEERKLHAAVPNPFKRHKSLSVLLTCYQGMLFTLTHTDSVIINLLRACVTGVQLLGITEELCRSTVSV